MSKKLKGYMRDELKARFDGVDGGVFLSTQGLNSEKTYAFRAALQAKNVKYTVLRNALAKQALAEHGYSGLDKVLAGPVGVAYSTDENSAATSAKAVADWKAETRDKIVAWKGAFLEGEVLGPQDAENLKDAPTKDQARAMLLGLMQAPATQFLATIRETYARAAYVLQAFADKQKDGGAAS